ncbi:unnamed protein product [Tuber aestivum]|uniref:Uncharacterized protein n=1 Tax=Tuber aestivum TaxID=59557 RepID=A0A292Q6P4_9PEZI|nr:unnamed protein product [Tuber aestivum]
MPSSQNFAVKTLISRFDKSDNLEKEERDTDGVRLVEVLAIIIAALTLLAAMIPLFRRSRLHRWVSSLLISPFTRPYNPAQKPLGIPIPDPEAAVVTTTEDSRATPVAELPLPGPVLIYNDCSNTYFVDTLSYTLLYDCGGITGEDGRVRQVEEPLRPRRPEPAIARRFS